MAQDVRPYKSKEQDGQGNEVIIRDQQLVEQTSQTTMASGEYFEIVDVDGRMAKIPKDNMIGVVREALGTLLNSLTDQTTVAKFLTLNGNTLGASAAATAASVLGDCGSKSYSDYQSIDDIHDNVNVQCSFPDTQSQTTWGSPTRYGVLFSRKTGGSYEIHLYFAHGTSAPKIEYRTFNGTIWSDWYNVSFVS